MKGDAKWGAYRGADAFILPSHQENFGIVVAEAMACGATVLITSKVNIWRGNRSRRRGTCRKGRRAAGTEARCAAG
ncbi:glycosyltransferase [Caulobacter segnis]